MYRTTKASIHSFIVFAKYNMSKKYMRFGRPIFCSYNTVVRPSSSSARNLTTFVSCKHSYGLRNGTGQFRTILKTTGARIRRTVPGARITTGKNNGQSFGRQFGKISIDGSGVGGDTSNPRQISLPAVTDAGNERWISGSQQRRGPIFQIAAKIIGVVQPEFSRHARCHPLYNRQKRNSQSC